MLTQPMKRVGLFLTRLLVSVIGYPIVVVFVLISFTITMPNTFLLILEWLGTWGLNAWQAAAAVDVILSLGMAVYLDRKDCRAGRWAS